MFWLCYWQSLAGQKKGAVKAQQVEDGGFYLGSGVLCGAPSPEVKNWHFQRGVSEVSGVGKLTSGARFGAGVIAWFLWS